MQNSIVFAEALINVFVLVVLTGYLAYIWMNSKKTDLLVYYGIMHLFAILVMISSYMIKAAPTEQLKWICIFSSSIIKSCFAISFLNYGYFFNYQKGLRKRIKQLLWSYPIISMLCILTNPYHNMFVKGLSVNGVTYGAFYFCLLTIGYILQIAGAAYMIMFLIGQDKTSVYRVSVMAITLSAFTIQFLFESGIIYSPIDIQPILMLAVFTFLFFGAYRLGLLNTLSLGVIRSLRLFNAAVLVLDEKGNEAYKNEACGKLGADAGRHIAEACKDMLDIAGLGQDEQGTIYQKDIAYNDKVLSVSIQPVRTSFRNTFGYVCIIHDDTSIISLINDLKEKNGQLTEMNENIRVLAEDIKRLAVIEERNILAKEIHDVLGHSMNLAFHIFESNKMIIDEHPEKVMKRLKQAAEDMDRGLGEIEIAASSADKKEMNSFTEAHEQLMLMSERLKEVGVTLEFTAINDLNGCNEDILKVILRICQEASTNAIKHGQADKVIIAIKKKERSLVLHIIDNGKGCTAFVKGSGLKGMEDRIRKVGGVISFGPFDDCNGFLVHASIPLQAEA